jgi:Arc/MetJ family transcription regulator
MEGTALRWHSDVYMMTDLYTRSVIGMRTNIQIDDELLSRAMAATGLSTKRATVEEGLRLLVRMREQAKALAELRGLGWQGDLNKIRQGRPPRQS